MGNFAEVLLLFVSLIVFASAASNYTQDYSWRDYNGRLPVDAFVAGLDKNRPIYVGQVVHGNQIIPGQIFFNENKIHFESNQKALVKSETVKILCTEHPEKFEWKTTTAAEHHKIKHLNLVKGGAEEGYGIYIGQVHDNGSDHVGKVVCRESNCLALYTAQNGKVVKYQTYHILTHHA